MRLRVVVTALLIILAVPLTAGAQQRGKTWRVGFLSGGARTPDGSPPLPLRQALKERGYIEQQNVVYFGRWADAKRIGCRASRPSSSDSKSTSS